METSDGSGKKHAAEELAPAGAGIDHGEQDSRREALLPPTPGQTHRRPEAGPPGGQTDLEWRASVSRTVQALDQLAERGYRPAGHLRIVMLAAELLFGSLSGWQSEANRRAAYWNAMRALGRARRGIRRSSTNLKRRCVTDEAARLLLLRAIDELQTAFRAARSVEADFPLQIEQLRQQVLNAMLSVLSAEGQVSRRSQTPA